MAVAFDAASSAFGSAVTSLSWSHTCTGADRVLIVGASLYAPQTVSALTYAGAALTSIGAVEVATDSRAEQWRRIAPATGLNTVAITLSAASSCVGGAVSATSVDQTTPAGTQATATGTSLSPSVTVTAATGDLVVDVVSHNPITIGGTAGAGQTARWGTGANNDLEGLGSTAAGAASVVMGWTLVDGTGAWAQCGVAFKAVAAVTIFTAETLQQFNVPLILPFQPDWTWIVDPDPANLPTGTDYVATTMHQWDQIGSPSILQFVPDWTWVALTDQASPVSDFTAEYLSSIDRSPDPPIIAFVPDRTWIDDTYVIPVVASDYDATIMHQWDQIGSPAILQFLPDRTWVADFDPASPVSDFTAEYMGGTFVGPDWFWQSTWSTGGPDWVTEYQWSSLPGSTASVFVYYPMNQLVSNQRRSVVVRPPLNN